ncbi:MAG: YeeE/YedE thiosulfate transporter family protein, partial [Ignavibacteriaceae bacterium]
MTGPLVNNGIISGGINSLFAVLIGILFGYALQRSGFTNSKKISAAFYMKDVDVPVVMFTAIITASIGLWGMSLLGLIDLGKMYFLPSFLLPMVVAGFIFGIGMAVGGFCPGTSLASMVTGKIDAMVFVGGFLIGSLFFGDFYSLWD